MQKEDYSSVFEKFVPSTAVDYCLDLWWHFRFEFKITKNRQSKLGDYRWHPEKQKHIITVNHNLNRYSFLLTYIHEIAHLVVFEEHKNRVDPHGKEWKKAFKKLMLPVLNDTVYPDDVLRPLARYMKNPKASSYSDPALIEALYQYDEGDEKPFLKDIPELSNFHFQKKNFKKLELRRTRYLCEELRSGRKYLISQSARVQPLEG